VLYYLLTQRSRTIGAILFYLRYLLLKLPLSGLSLSSNRRGGTITVARAVISVGLLRYD
jgi:hypothetical protein